MAIYALNFYSPVVADQLRSGRKTATIRLGDKSSKYKKGMIVTPLRELSPREIEHDNPEIRRTEEFSRWLGQLYNREVDEGDTVTIIRFSAIVGTMF